MMTGFNKIYRLFLLNIILLIVVTSFAAFYTSGDNSFVFRSNKIESAINRTNILQNDTFKPADSGSIIMDAENEQLFDQEALNFIFIINKNMLVLFSTLIIIFSFYLFCLYIRRWIILVSNLKIKYFILHYLQLKDGKKDASFFFSV